MGTQRKIWLLILLLIPQIFLAQNNRVVHPKTIKYPLGFQVISSLRDRPVVTDFSFHNEEFYLNSHKEREIRNDLPLPDFSRIYGNQAHRPTRNLATVQPTILQNFEGQNTGAFPPDANGSVNDNYYFQTVNVTYAIYDKNGNILAGPSDLNTIFDSSLPGAGYNDGDPIVLWDEQAQKWFYAEFSVNGSNDYMLIAVSQTADPTGAWWSWSYDVDDMPDYMKFGIWQDGYYMATNTSSGNDVYVFERSKMIQGDPNPAMIGFDNPNRPSTFDGFHAIMPLDNDGAWAPAGTPGQFITVVDDDQSNPADQLWIYELDVDWQTPANSTFQRTQTINIPSFTGNFSNDWQNIPQPGTTQKLDAVSTVLMFRANYRNFNGDQRLVVAHTIAQSATEGAIRWYELQNNGSGWSIRQQGEVDLNGTSAWLPSIAINARKEIAIGYSVSDGNSTYPSIYITGQTQDENASASGVLNVQPTLVQSGQYAQTQYERWGDYANMSVDPNGTTFWFTTEYVKQNTHGTRIVAFEFPVSCTPPATQASQFAVTGQTGNSLTISWSRGDGDAVLVMAREGSAVNADPQSGTSYTANATFGSGSEIGTGNFVVYDGTGTSVTVTGLNAGTTYYFALYEYNNTDVCYLTPALTGNGTTNGPPTVVTNNMQSIGSTSAVASGEVVSENGSTVTERGFCWSTSPNPDLSGNHITSGSGTGSFTGTLTGLTPSTTYYVRAYATNTDGTSYGDNVSFRTACSVVSGFPYLETFNTWAESNPGTSCTADGSVALSDCWENQSGDDADWDILSGGTPSSGTGPFYDANDWDGRYIYLEASGCDNKTASVVTPLFDFSELQSPELRFWTHMRGADMGTLTVQISTDGGASWSSDIFSVSGDHGESWNEHIVDLSAYAGQSSVQIRFTGQTGSSYLSDMALDNVLVQEATGITSVTSYCSAAGNMSFATAITAVQFGNINVASGKYEPYNNYAQIRTAVKLAQTYPLTVRVNTDGDYTVYAKCWIDWNADGDFDDAGEEYDLGFATNVSDGATSASPLDITVPANAVLGKTRMRISAKYNSAPSACETGFDGETEDYELVVYDICQGVAQWNGNLWKTFAGDTLALSDLQNKFLYADNMLHLKTEDLDACSAANRKGNTLIVDENRYLRLNYDLTNRGYLEVRNNGALVQTDDAGIIEGGGIYVLNRTSDTLEHYYDYVYWSSPLNSTTFTLGDVVPNAWRYYAFDATVQNPNVTPNSGWIQKQATDAFVTGQGFAVSAENGQTPEVIHAHFRKDFDPFNNGAISVPVYINGTGAADGDDWNLLGNPYPSALDFDLFVQANTNIQGGLYLWTNCAGLNAQGQHQESGYTVYTLAGATAACSGTGPVAGQYVAAGQGFMVEANTAGNVTFSNAYRSTQNDHFVNRLVHDRAWFDFVKDDGTHFGQILIGFHAAATDDTDRLFDAHAISDRWFSFWNGQKFAINTLAAWDGNTRIVPVGYKASDAGTFSISLHAREGALQNLHIYLRDYTADRLHDLTTGAYTFSSAAGTFTGRFEIIFSPVMLKAESFEDNAQLRLLSDGRGHFKIRGENISGVRVYDLNGRLIRHIQTESASVVPVDLTGIARQPLIFKVSTTQGGIKILKGIR